MSAIFGHKKLHKSVDVMVSNDTEGICFPFARVKLDLNRTMLQWWKRAISQETGLETPG